ncbi:MAG: tetratricopeptide repeat protein [Elusimicrobiales bacterium]|nr:tetratricopeptide repeat protein [Elusimicrobiales bacterium]
MKINISSGSFKMAFFLFLSSLAVCPASAWFFFQPKNKAAESILKDMEKAYDKGNCLLVHELYEKIFAENPSAEIREKVYNYVGICYEKSGPADKAISIYKLASGLYPKNAFFSYRLALIYNETGFYDKALPLFKTAIKKHFNEVGALVGAARASEKLGKLGEAAKYYEEALSNSEDEDISVIKEFASCLIKSARFEEARAVIEKGYAIKPEADWPALIAKTFAAEGRFDDASAAMASAIGYDPKREYRISKGFYDYWAGNKEAAESAADDLLAADGKDFLAAFLKGLLLYSSDKKSEADKYFRLAACGGNFVSEAARKMSSAELPDAKELCK